MKKKDKIIAKALGEILYSDDYGWPPVCVGIFYQPERPVSRKVKERANGGKTTDK